MLMCLQPALWRILCLIVLLFILQTAIIASENSPVTNKSTKSFALSDPAEGSSFDYLRLVVATYLGGANLEEGWPSIPTVFDAEGNIIMAIGTYTNGLYTSAGGYDPGYNGSGDVYIVKINPELKEIMAATYLGGSGLDRADAIAITGSGQIYIMGWTTSSNFPTTEGAYDRTHGSSDDIFVACLSGDFTTLIASTFIGGNGSDIRGDVAVSIDGSVFTLIETSSAGLYTSLNAIRGAYCGGSSDLYLIRLDAGLTSALAATYLGGNAAELRPGLAIDNDGNVYGTGCTFSANFPISPDAYDPYNNDGGLDAFITYLGMNLDTIFASTFIGGIGDDWIYCVERAGNGDLYISGHVAGQWPTTPGCFDSTYGGGPGSGDDAYLSRFSSDLSTLKASTFLGGNHWDWGVDVAIDDRGLIYVTGETMSTDFPYTDSLHDTPCCDSMDIFISVFDSSMQSLQMSTFIRGSERDRYPAILTIPGHGFYMMGYTESDNLETTPGCYDPSYGGSGDIYIAAFSYDPFTRITDIDPVGEAECSFGVSWADYDDDEYPDLFVTRWWSSGSNLNVLYHNNGDGSFSSRTDLAPGQEGNSLSAVWGDYDNDGDEDLLAVCPGVSGAGAANHFYKNGGDGSFTKITSDPVAADMSPSIHAISSDFDADGDLDLIVSNHNYPSGLSYYQNEAGNFTRLTNGAIGLDSDDCGAVSVGDADNDGFPEFVHARNMLTSKFFFNDGDGTFTDELNVVSEDSTRAYSWGDYDNDGDLDLCGGDDWSRGLIIYDNDGIGGFAQWIVDSSDTRTTVMRKPHWVDFDNDGDLDLFVCTQGTAYSPVANDLYINEAGVFSKLTTSVLTSDSYPSSGAAWADYDRDGDLDLFVANTNFSQDAFYRNEIGNRNNWISIMCSGISTNRSGIGATVRIKATIGGSVVWQMREISSQSGFLGQNEMLAHFGLGDAAIIDSIIVEWPGGPVVDRLTGVAVNQYLTISETICGDANGDGQVNVGDAVFLISYIFKGGPAPDPVEAADANGDGETNVGDAVYIINFVFKGGPPPSADCYPYLSVIDIPFGSPVMIDGTIATGEWSDAVLKRFTVDNQVDITVMIKHDGANLLAAYWYQFEQDENLCFPELLIDIGNDKSESWSSNDWWFHVSGTDCEAQGTYDVWYDCSVIQPDWQGVPNFAMVPDPPPLDTFEIRIPFSKLGVSVGETIGLAFRAEYVPLTYGYWPPEATVGSPATWGTAILKP